jgi:hypothetical protein
MGLPPSLVSSSPPSAHTQHTLICIRLPGALVSQVLIGPVHEQTAFSALLLLQATFAFGGQMLGVGSSAIFFLSGLPLFVVLVINRAITGSTKEIALVTYALGSAFPLLGGVLLLIPVVEVFVPLVRRLLLFLLVWLTLLVFPDRPHRRRRTC